MHECAAAEEMKDAGKVVGQACTEAVATWPSTEFDCVSLRSSNVMSVNYLLGLIDEINRKLKNNEVCGSAGN